MDVPTQTTTSFSSFQPFIPSTAQEWYSFIQLFKQSSDSRHLLLHSNNEAGLLDNLIKTVANKLEKDDTLKVNLLVFLQENVNFFLEEDPKRLERVYHNFISMCTSTTDTTSAGSIQVRCQILVVLTTIIVEQSIIKTQPKLFESFTESLYDTIAKINSGPDRLVRSIACNCLQELELTYPGLLSHALGHLFQLCQNESTHVLQSYLSLFTIVLKHVTQLMTQEGTSASMANPRPITRTSSTSNLMSGLLSNEVPLIPFIIPSITRYSPFAQVGTIVLSESLAKEVQRGLSMVIDQLPQLNGWGVVTIVPSIIPFVDLVSLPVTTFRHPHFYRLMFTSQLLFFHILLYLSKMFPEVYTQSDHIYIVNRLICFAKDTFMPLERRILVLEWLVSLAKTAAPASLLAEHFRDFYPSVFDPLDIKEAKFHVLAKCFSRSSPPPQNFLEVLICVSEFVHYKADDRIAFVVFSVLLEILVEFPNMIESVYEFILHTILNYPKFLMKVIALVDSISESTIVHKILVNFNAVLVALAPHKLQNYLPLAERVVMAASINPNGILVATRDFLRVCSEISWQQGQTILSIARWILLQHQRLSTFKALADLLHHATIYFADLEIRDRAHFYLMMLTHLPPEKVIHVLTQQNTPTDEENVEFVSPFVPKTKLVKSLPKFLLLCREPHMSPIPKFENASNDLQVIDNTANAYSQYMLYLNIAISCGHKFSINIPYLLTYKNNMQQHFPKKVYALLIQFSENSAYEPLAPLRIPYLAMFDSQTSGYKTEVAEVIAIDKTFDMEFPFLYRVVLRFTPKLPLPVSFFVKVLFNDGEGKTCKGEIDTVSLNFPDLFMQITLPDLQGMPHNNFVQQLFEEMWHVLGGKAPQTYIAPGLGIPLQDNDHAMGMKSVKHLDISRVEMRRIIGTHLTNYVIPQYDSTTASTTHEERVLIFLPPKYHLMMKFKILEKSTIVKIRTDFWKILPYVDTYFALLVEQPP